MITASRPALALLQQYAEYHRDRRNIATHFVGVPMTIFALGVFGAGVSFTLGGLALTPAWVAFALVAAWYLTRGQAGLGAATVLGVGLLVLLAHQVDSASTGSWLALWLSCFVLGWTLQFVGHYYEGRRPPLSQDRRQWLIGPMFVVLEMAAPLGWFRSLADAIERHAGPTIIRDLAHPATR